MKIYFGQITGEYLESRVEDGSTMFMYEGRAYEYAMEVYIDHIIINDTVGRKMPFDMEDLLPLYKALTPLMEVASITKEYMMAKDMIDNTDILCV